MSVPFDAKNALLSNTVDYAGTFPPASLSLEETLRKYISYRTQAHHPWLLYRLVLPLGTILELSAPQLYDLGANGSGWNFTTLQTGAVDGDGMAQLKESSTKMQQLNASRQNSGLPLRILSLETKMLGDTLSPTIDWSTWARKVAGATELVEGAVRPMIYFEVPTDSGSLEQLPKLVGALLEAKVGFGLKVRTGGATPPSFESLATFLGHCARFRVPFKATQGLHHPISGSDYFGFVNLFAAVTFQVALGEEKFNATSVEQCLKESDKKAFRFEREKFTWQQWELGVDQILEARSFHQGCFGSCSIDEPDQFLYELNV